LRDGYENNFTLTGSQPLPIDKKVDRKNQALLGSNLVGENIKIY
jgi:hypothetical protein